MAIVHCVDVYLGSSDREVQRLQRAQKSWASLGDGVSRTTLERDGPKQARDSRLLGSTRRLPFIRDILDEGFRLAESMRDILVLTNADSGLVVQTASFVSASIGRGAGQYDVGYAHRRDWYKPVRVSIDLATNRRMGEESPGVDMIAMSCDWWKENRLLMPDLLMGVEGWDWVWKYTADIQLPELVWHEHHGNTPQWMVDRTKEPANLWNRMLCAEWARRRPDWETLMREWPAIRQYESEHMSSVERFAKIRAAFIRELA